MQSRGKEGCPDETEGEEEPAMEGGSENVLDERKAHTRGQRVGGPPLLGRDGEP